MTGIPDTTLLTGVYPVIATPFDADGSIDVPSLRRLVEYLIASGVDGMVVFGLASELYKLTDDDRRMVLGTVIDAAADRVPVVAGTEHTGFEGAIARSTEAVHAGAKAVMLYPPTFVKPDAQGVEDYYRSIAAAVPVPIVVQDAPNWTGTPLPIDLLARLRAAASTVGWVKVESLPSAPKVTALRAQGFRAIGGYGAVHLPEDLDAGVCAIMPGCGIARVYTELWRLYHDGERDGFWERFTAALPLLSFQMSSLDLFIAVQKELLVRTGVFSSGSVRRPGSALSDYHRSRLDELLVRTGLGRFLES